MVATAFVMGALSRLCQKMLTSSSVKTRSRGRSMSADERPGSDRIDEVLGNPPTVDGPQESEDPVRAHTSPAIGDAVENVNDVAFGDFVGLHRSNGWIDFTIQHELIVIEGARGLVGAPMSIDPGVRHLLKGGEALRL